MKPGNEIVYVAEYGHGARKGKAINRFRQGDSDRVLVEFEDGTPTRKCFASSVFTNRADAEKAAV